MAKKASLADLSDGQEMMFRALVDRKRKSLGEICSWWMANSELLKGFKRRRGKPAHWGSVNLRNSVYSTCNALISRGNKSQNVHFRFARIQSNSTTEVGKLANHVFWLHSHQIDIEDDSDGYDEESTVQQPSHDDQDSAADAFLSRRGGSRRSKRDRVVPARFRKVGPGAPDGMEGDYAGLLGKVSPRANVDGIQLQAAVTRQRKEAWRQRTKRWQKALKRSVAALQKEKDPPQASEELNSSVSKESAQDRFAPKSVPCKNQWKQVLSQVKHISDKQLKDETIRLDLPMLFHAVSTDKAVHSSPTKRPTATAGTPNTTENASVDKTKEDGLASTLPTAAGSVCNSVLTVTTNDTTTTVGTVADVASKNAVVDPLEPFLNIPSACDWMGRSAWFPEVYDGYQCPPPRAVSSEIACALALAPVTALIPEETAGGAASRGDPSSATTGRGKSNGAQQQLEMTQVYLHKLNHHYQKVHNSTGAAPNTKALLTAVQSLIASSAPAGASAATVTTSAAGIATAATATSLARGAGGVAGYGVGAKPGTNAVSMATGAAQGDAKISIVGAPGVAGAIAANDALAQQPPTKSIASGARLLDLVEMKKRQKAAGATAAQYTTEWMEHFDTDVEEKTQKVTEYNEKILALEERQKLSEQLLEQQEKEAKEKLEQTLEEERVTEQELKKAKRLRMRVQQSQKELHRTQQRRQWSIERWRKQQDAANEQKDKVQDGIHLLDKVKTYRTSLHEWTNEHFMDFQAPAGLAHVDNWLHQQEKLASQKEQALLSVVSVTGPRSGDETTRSSESQRTSSLSPPHIRVSAAASVTGMVSPKAMALFHRDTAFPSPVARADSPGASPSPQFAKEQVTAVGTSSNDGSGTTDINGSGSCTVISTLTVPSSTRKLWHGTVRRQKAWQRLGKTSISHTRVAMESVRLLQRAWREGQTRAGGLLARDMMKVRERGEKLLSSLQMQRNVQQEHLLQRQLNDIAAEAVGRNDSSGAVENSLSINTIDDVDTVPGNPKYVGCTVTRICPIRGLVTGFIHSYQMGQDKKGENGRYNDISEDKATKARNSRRSSRTPSSSSGSRNAGGSTKFSRVASSRTNFGKISKEDDDNFVAGRIPSSPSLSPKHRHKLARNPTVNAADLTPPEEGGNAFLYSENAPEVDHLAAGPRGWRVVIPPPANRINARGQVTPTVGLSAQPKVEILSEHDLREQLSNTTTVFVHASSQLHKIPKGVPESPDRVRVCLVAMLRLARTEQRKWKLKAREQAQPGVSQGQNAPTSDHASGENANSCTTAGTSSAGIIDNRRDKVDEATVRKLELVVYPENYGSVRTESLLLVHSAHYLRRLVQLVERAERRGRFVAVTKSKMWNSDTESATDTDNESDDKEDGSVDGAGVAEEEEEDDDGEVEEDDSANDDHDTDDNTNEKMESTAANDGAFTHDDREAVRALLRSRNWQQKTIAKSAGVSPSGISAWLNKRHLGPRDANLPESIAVWLKEHVVDLQQSGFMFNFSGEDSTEAGAEHTSPGTSPDTKSWRELLLNSKDLSTNSGSPIRVVIQEALVSAERQGAPQQAVRCLRNSLALYKSNNGCAMRDQAMLALRIGTNNESKRANSDDKSAKNGTKTGTCVPTDSHSLRAPLTSSLEYKRDSDSQRTHMQALVEALNAYMRREEGTLNQVASEIGGLNEKQLTEWVHKHSQISARHAVAATDPETADTTEMHTSIVSWLQRMSIKIVMDLEIESSLEGDEGHVERLRKISVKDLAKELGLQQSQLSVWLNGRVGSKRAPKANKMQQTVLQWGLEKYEVYQRLYQTKHLLSTKDQPAKMDLVENPSPPAKAEAVTAEGGTGQEVEPCEEVDSEVGEEEAGGIYNVHGGEWPDIAIRLSRTVISKHGVTQTALAEYVGVSSANFSLWLNNRLRAHTPTVELVRAHIHQWFLSCIESSGGTNGVGAAAALAAAGDKGWMSAAASQIAVDMRREENSFTLSDANGDSKYTSRGTRRIGKRKRGGNRSRRRLRQTVLTKRRLVSSWCSEEERQRRAKRQCILLPGNEGQQGLVGTWAERLVRPDKGGSRPVDSDDEGEDTFLCSASLAAALKAAATVCQAVDRVLLGSRTKAHRASNAFCLIRPPGHHCGRCGATHSVEQNGFCLLNNVTVGIAHARLHWGVHKVAVVDVDVHFGNGTAELLKDDENAFFSSTHLHVDKDDFYPGSDLTKTEINEDIGYVSIGLGKSEKATAAAAAAVAAASNRAKRQGSSDDEDGDDEDEKSSENENRSDVELEGKRFKKSDEGDLPVTKETHDPTLIASAEIVLPGSVAGSAAGSAAVSATEHSQNLGTDENGCQIQSKDGEAGIGLRGPAGFRAALLHHILPAVRRFKPEMIFISAGFDGLASDPLGGALGLSIQDYVWATAQIANVAEDVCQGRLVSVLEGGYDVSPLSNGLACAVEAHVEQLMR